MDRAKTRKPHKKSRNGCLPCKGRHVKVPSTSGNDATCANRAVECDEQKPACANCVKQGTACEYRPSRSREASNPSPPVFTPSSTEGACTFVDRPLPEYGPNPTNGVSGPDLTLNLPQMRLLQYVEAEFLRDPGVGPRTTFLISCVLQKSPELLQDLLRPLRIVC
jgi:hypothetical protein